MTELPPARVSAIPGAIDLTKISGGDRVTLMRSALLGFAPEYDRSGEWVGTTVFTSIGRYSVDATIEEIGRALTAMESNQ